MAQQYGYAGNILRVDLSSKNTSPVMTSDYSERFLGGRGLAAKIYWDEVSPDTRALDEDNRLIFALGPLAGIPLLGGSRWGVFGKSPLSAPEQFCYGNLGGRWGAALKFAGYDGLAFQGKSDRPVYLLINEDNAEIRDAAFLWGKGARETRDILKKELGKEARVVSIGPAGENMVSTATLLADDDASGSGGLGAVMGSKRLKAIAVKGAKKEIKIADPERLRKITDFIRGLGKGNVLVWGMDFMAQGEKSSRAPCYGCLGHCVRANYKADNGMKGKFMCQSRFFYLMMALEYYGEENDVPFYANKLCDDHGLDTWELQSTLEWLVRCHQAGIISEKTIGLPMTKVGSLEFIEAMVSMISSREGFGDILAGGLEKAAQEFGDPGVLQIKHVNAYDPRLYITNALLFPFEPREPIQQVHEVGLTLAQWVSWAKGVAGAHISSDVLRGIAIRFWGGEAAADFTTYEGKALAAKKIQDRQYVKESLMLCDWMYPVLDIPNSEDHIGDPTIESKIVTAVLGIEVDEPSLNTTGERVLNLQRAILAREGRRGRVDDTLPDEWHTSPMESHVADPDCLVPGKKGEPISRLGSVVDKQEFEGMKDEYYRLRGWDVGTGLQTKMNLRALGLDDIVDDLDHRGLIVTSE